MVKRRNSSSQSKRNGHAEVPRALIRRRWRIVQQRLRRQRGDDAISQNATQPVAVNLRDYIPPETPTTGNEGSNGNQNQSNGHRQTNDADQDVDQGYVFRVGVHSRVHPVDGIPPLAEDAREHRIVVVFRGDADIFTPATFLLAVGTILQRGLGDRFHLPRGIVLNQDMAVVITLGRPDDGDFLVTVNVE